MKQHVQLPRLPDSLIQTCDTLIEKGASRLQTVQRLMTFIKEGKTYTAAPQEIPSDVDTVNYFLTEMEKGSCSHFASALAVTCRIAGIPARVVTGFGPGSFDKTSMRWTVREKDSHAWTQVWFPHYGWRDFDPTPARFERGNETTASQRQTTQEAVQRYKGKLSSLVQRLPPLWTSTERSIKQHWAWYLTIFILTLGAFPLLIAIYWVGARLAWYARWFISGWLNPADSARLMYRCTLQWIRREGIVVEKSMTPSEVVETIRDKDVPWYGHFYQFSERAQQMMFGQNEWTNSDREQLRQLAREVKQQLHNSES